MPRSSEHPPSLSLWTRHSVRWVDVRLRISYWCISYLDLCNRSERLRFPRNSTVLPAASMHWSQQTREANFTPYSFRDNCTIDPCGNFSDTSSLKFLKTKGSIGHAFTVCIHTENQNQRSFYPFVLHEISVLIELLLGHLCYRLTDVPPQPNSPPDFVSRVEWPWQTGFKSRNRWPKRPRVEPTK